MRTLRHAVGRLVGKSRVSGRYVWWFYNYN